VIGVKPGNTVVDRKLPSELCGGAKDDSVYFIVNPVGEPDAGNPHVRFDERGWETERRFDATAPILDSTDDTAPERQGPLLGSF